MAFFRTVSLSEQIPAVTGDDVVLRAPQMSDCAEWAALREASRSFLTPWEPTWPADDLTRPSFRRRIRRYFEDQRNDLAYAFFIFRKHDDVLLGGLTLANIRRGCAQAASLGYWMGAAYARQGHMTAAVNAVGGAAIALAATQRIEERARQVLEKGRTAESHIFNLGHGVLPDTDPDMLARLTDLVHSIPAGSPG